MGRLPGLNSLPGSGYTCLHNPVHRLRYNKGRNMAKPTPEEMETALSMAKQMRDRDVDPFFIAKALLNLNYRFDALQEVLQAADRYVNMGMSEQERTRLIRAIDKAKDIESYTSHSARSSFGLE